MSNPKCQTTFCPFINGECVGNSCMACTTEVRMIDKSDGKEEKFINCSLMTMANKLEGMASMIRDVNEATETLQSLLSEMKQANEFLSGIESQVGG